MDIEEVIDAIREEPIGPEISTNELLFYQLRGRLKISGEFAEANRYYGIYLQVNEEKIRRGFFARR